MPKTYVEFNLNLERENELDKAVFFAQHMDYKDIVVNNDKEFLKFKDFPEPLEIQGIKFYRKVILTGVIKNMQKQLSKERFKNHVVMVKPISAKEATWAVLQPMIDGLFLSADLSGRETWDNVASLLNKHGKIVEFDMSPLVFCSEKELSRILRTYIRLLQPLNPNKHRIVLSSGGSGVWGLRRAKAIRGLSKAFGLGLQYTGYSMSVYPRQLIKNNIEKLRPNYLGGGVWVIKDE